MWCFVDMISVTNNHGPTAAPNKTATSTAFAAGKALALRRRLSSTAAAATEAPSARYAWERRMTHRQKVESRTWDFQNFTKPQGELFGCTLQRCDLNGDEVISIYIYSFGSMFGYEPMQFWADLTSTFFSMEKKGVLEQSSGGQHSVSTPWLAQVEGIQRWVMWVVGSNGIQNKWLSCQKKLKHFDQL